MLEVSKLLCFTKAFTDVGTLFEHQVIFMGVCINDMSFISLGNCLIPILVKGDEGSAPRSCRMMIAKILEVSLEFLVACGDGSGMGGDGSGMGGDGWFQGWFADALGVLYLLYLDILEKR